MVSQLAPASIGRGFPVKKFILPTFQQSVNHVSLKTGSLRCHTKVPTAHTGRVSATSGSTDSIKCMWSCLHAVPCPNMASWDKEAVVIKILLYRMGFPLHPSHHFPWASLLHILDTTIVISEQSIPKKGKRNFWNLSDIHLDEFASRNLSQCYYSLVCMYVNCLPNFSRLLLLLCFQLTFC